MSGAVDRVKSITDHLSGSVDRSGNGCSEYGVARRAVPMQAIVMATKAAAELLRMDHLVGTVEVGKEADLLVLDGDPLDDIAMLQDRARLRRVYQAGDLVAGTDLTEARPN